MSPLAILCFSLIALARSSTSLSAGDDSPTAYEVLQQFDFPVGLLPQGVTSYEFDNSTGQFAVYLDQTCSFSISGYNLRYKSKITGVLTKDRIKNLGGVSVKVLFIWLNIVEVIRDGNNIEFSVGIASADFDISSFFGSPQCGCGFDCVNGRIGENHEGKFQVNRFVSSS